MPGRSESAGAADTSTPVASCLITSLSHPLPLRLKCPLRDANAEVSAHISRPRSRTARRTRVTAPVKTTAPRVCGPVRRAGSICPAWRSRCIAAAAAAAAAARPPIPPAHGPAAGPTKQADQVEAMRSYALRAARLLRKNPRWRPSRCICHSFRHVHHTRIPAAGELDPPEHALVCCGSKCPTGSGKFSSKVSNAKCLETASHTCAASMADWNWPTQICCP